MTIKTPIKSSTLLKLSSTMRLSITAMIKNFLFILCILLTLGCEKWRDHNIYPDPNQFILFQVEYMNAAWGSVHEGILIDSSGKVSGFINPSPWKIFNSTGYISESDMEFNLQHLDTFSYKINKSEMLNYFSKVGDISHGKLSKPYHRMYDTGGIDFLGLFYDPKNHTYKKVLIKSWGDFVIDNSAPESEEVYQWLSKKYSDFFSMRRNN